MYKLIWWGGSTCILALYKYTTREIHKKFFWAKWLGVKMCPYSRKRVIFGFLKGCLGTIFQNPLFYPSISQKNLVWVQNHTKFLVYRSVFSWKRQISIRVCFQNLWSHMCTKLAFKFPPPLWFTPGVSHQKLFCHSLSIYFFAYFFKAIVLPSTGQELTY